MINSKFMKFMDQFADLLLLNLLWLVFSLPLITLGAATAAASSLILKELDGEAGPLVRSFWREFRANLRRGTGLGLLNLAGAAALAVDFRLIQSSAEPPVWLLAVTFATAALVLLSFLYAYPLTARFENTVWRTLQNSLLLSLRYFGRTLLILGLVAFEVALMFWNTTMLFFALAVGPMVILTTVTGVARGVFRKVQA